MKAQLGLAAWMAQAVWSVTLRKADVGSSRTNATSGWRIFTGRNVDVAKACLRIYFYRISMFVFLNAGHPCDRSWYVPGCGWIIRRRTVSLNWARSFLQLKIYGAVLPVNLPLWPLLHCEPKKTPKCFLIYNLQNLTDCDNIWYILSSVNLSYRSVNVFRLTWCVFSEKRRLSHKAWKSVQRFDLGARWRKKGQDKTEHDTWLRRGRQVLCKFLWKSVQWGLLPK